jgi:hypothetical protein
MVRLCIYCNHAINNSHILKLKNFQGPLITICPLDFSLLNVLEQQMVFEKHGYHVLLGILQTWSPSLEIALCN